LSPLRTAEISFVGGVWIFSGTTIYILYSVRRFLQKTENRKPTGKNRKNRVNRIFLKIRSKIETTVKKDTTRYSVLTQDIKRKVF
jgi:hypothetical protein